LDLNLDLSRLSQKRTAESKVDVVLRVKVKSIESVIKSIESTVSILAGRSDLKTYIH
jgi:hypothetical protein